MKQLTKKEAIEFYNSKVYENWTAEQIVRLQLFQDLLCVDWSLFHKSIEKVLGRPVYTHEFASKESIMLEYLGEKEPPTLDEIIGLIPKEKLLIIGK